MRVTARQTAFSLVEAAVAVAVLALSCVAVSSVAALCLRAEAQDTHARELVVTLDRECARLRTLPFYRPMEGPGEGPASLLQEVFPHACAWLNTAEAAYQDGASDISAGAFVTLGDISGAHMRCTARFVHVGDGVVTPVDAADEQGWTAWSRQPPPSAALSVRLEAVCDGARATRSLVICGVRPSLASVCVGGPGVG